jgi:hypothetical protein
MRRPGEWAKNASRAGARGHSATLAVPEDGAYRPDMPTDDHALVNRATWDEDAQSWVQRGREAWAGKEPIWGRGNPESELHLLPDLAGVDAIELGCGTAYDRRRTGQVFGLVLSKERWQRA